MATYVENYTALITNASTWNHAYGRDFGPKPVFLTYSFAETRPGQIAGVSYGDPTYFRPLTAHERSMYREAIKAWEKVSGITFIEVPGGLGDFEAGGYRLSGNVAGQAALPNSGFYWDGQKETLFAPSDRYKGVYLDVESGMDFHVMLHEIGHALGLEHPHDGNDPLLAPHLDNGANTVMTYNGYPTELGRFDIEAIQALYGTPEMRGTNVASWHWDAANLTLTQHGGSGAETIHGTNAHDRIHANGGRDLVLTRGGNDVVDVDGRHFAVNAGSGFDVVTLDFGRGALRDHSRSDDVVHLLEQGASSWNMILMQTERVVFTDAVLAFDLEGIAGAAYRLYQAAFDRAPDEGGLGYWIRELDKGISMVAVADSFIHSAEFIRLYGTSQTVDSADFVGRLYANTLDRAYDVPGFNYWVERLETGQTNRADLLDYFAQSAENKNQVADQISDGIWYV